MDNLSGVPSDPPTELPHDDDASFWLGVSESSLNAVWGNTEDDVYAELLAGQAAG